MAAAGALLALGLPPAVFGQGLGSAGTTPSVSVPRASEAYPEFRTARDVMVFGAGAAMFAAGYVLEPDRLAVPEQGLDPVGIAWSRDRRILGNRSLDAHRASDRTVKAAMMLPFVMAFATGQADGRWEGFGRRSAVITQAFVVSQGITSLGKAALGRPRPYTYLSDDARPEDPAYDVTSRSAFSSMPSGHSSSAWTGATVAMTEYLLSHPEAGWLPRGAVGLLGGTLAGATSALRVEAGQHFPSDVLVGAGIGIVTGVAVPLLHRGQRASPSTRAWLEMTGGAVAGTALGILFARRY